LQSPGGVRRADGYPGRQASIDYLVAQLEAGADVVQLFESWALNLDDQWRLKHRVIGPNQAGSSRVCGRGCRMRRSSAFRAALPAIWPTMPRRPGVNAVGLDYATPLGFAARQSACRHWPVQGNLDPLRLVAGGAQLEERADARSSPPLPGPAAYLQSGARHRAGNPDRARGAA
jgi:uroporphyrinogen decarboxylase